MRFTAVLGSLWAAAAAHAAPCLKQAAALYHQGRYDSALAVLEPCRSEAAKRRDSLALFQYSGMAEARLGRAVEAESDFRALLAMDSLFQFPRNEDTAVLGAFARARNPAPGAAPAPAADPASAPVTEKAEAAPPAAAEEPLRMRPGPGPAPEPDLTRASRAPGIGMAMGAIPFGGGWLANGRYKHGLALAFLQAGGMALSLYASSRNSAIKGDRLGLTESEEARAQGWRLTQGISLSTALGAYLFSLIASRKE